MAKGVHGGDGKNALTKEVEEQLVCTLNGMQSPDMGTHAKAR